MPSPTDLTMLNLHALRKNLKRLMNPAVLKKFAELLESTSTADNGSLLDRYEHFARTSEHGPDCKYAQLAKQFFEKDEAAGCAAAIRWLYENWAKNYK
jgi:hypothetical protein